MKKAVNVLGSRNTLRDALLPAPLAEDPTEAAERLARDDPWILQRLHQAFDATHPEELEALSWLEQSIRALRGELSPSQRLKLTRARERAA